jgi:hypothetical protein
MSEMSLTHFRRRKSSETKIVHFAFQDLLPPGQTLVLSLGTRTLSLLQEGRMVMDQQFSVNELRLLEPILQAFPHYCPYEVLLAHLSAMPVTPNTVARCRQRLLEAQGNGRWQQELRPVRRALSSLRGKLHRFGLEISNVRERGCSLTCLTYVEVDMARREVV